MQHDKQETDNIIVNTHVILKSFHSTLIVEIFDLLFDAWTITPYIDFVRKHPRRRYIRNN